MPTLNAHVSTEHSTHTVQDFLKDYTLIEEALQVLSEKSFITESLFTQGYNAQGGGVTYHKSQGKYMNEDANGDDDFEIQEGSEFHQVYMSDVGPEIAKVKKFGIEGWITFEDEDRNQLGSLGRMTTRMMNTFTKHFDRRTLNLLRTDPTVQVFPTTGNWSTTTYGGIYDELLIAQDMIGDEGLTGGETYEADTLVVSNKTYSNIKRNTALRDLLGDRPENPYYKNTMESLAGLSIMKTPHMPNNVAFVLQKGAIGGIADEIPLTVKPPERNEAKEVIFVRMKRLTVPFLTDAKALVRIPLA